MPLRVGLFAYPLMLFFLGVSAKGGGAGRFVSAGARSVETSRRPESLGIRGGRDTLAGAIKRGVLVEVGDGRYFVDMTVYRRRQRALYLALGAVGLVGGSVTLWLWAPWR